MRPRISTVVSLDQLGYPKPSIRDAIHLASRINRDAGLLMLARFNLVQSVAAINAELTGNVQSRVRAQEKLISLAISDRRLRELKDKLGNTSLLDQILLHRAQLLLAMKLVARFGSSSRGIRFEKRDDYDVIGELALIINSLYDLPPSGSGTARDLAAQMSPFVELENLPHVDRALVRTAEMLGNSLRRTPQTNPVARNIERIFVFLTGLSFEALLDMTFAAFSFYAAPGFEEFIQQPSRAYLNPYNANNVVSADYLNRFLFHISVNFGEVPGTVELPGDLNRYLVDFTSFRQFPVWRFGPDAYLCVDPAFVMEKLSSGFYWLIMNALDSLERRREFSGLWGLLFQDYVLAVLADLYPAASGILFPQPFYESPREEAFDAVLHYGGRLVALEIKGSFVPVAAKYAGQLLPFFKGVSSRFGNTRAGAVQQLATNLRLTFGPSPGRRVSGLPTDPVSQIFPVVVVQEPVLRFSLVTRLLAERFARLTRKVRWRPNTTVRPVLFLQIEDLEALIPYVKDGDFTFLEVLTAKLAADPTHLHSFNDFLFGEFLPSKKLSQKPNTMLRQKFDRWRAGSLRRFGEGAYQ